MPPPKAHAKGSAAAEPKAEKDTRGSSGYTKIKVRHIFCEKHGKIMQAMEKLAEGKAFADVAKEYSEDKARQGGELGWKGKGEMVSEFSDAAYALPIGGVSEAPVKTPFGWHIILTEDKK
jgi:NIMA-interacting peptidyl-prolyl cis-trans isomerase 4